MANYRLRGDGRVKEAGAVGSPSEVVEIRRSVYNRAMSLERRPTTESSVNAPLVVIGGESIQLAMKVEAVPEERLVEILAPKGSDLTYVLQSSVSEPSQRCWKAGNVGAHFVDATGLGVG